ncbi:MAG: HAMP domain-containing sensor histidine kinase [Eubacteriales bacterium]|nr:HAMP domain-containing sensor histidine kinase [Eubacteriales bacterium]
MRKKGLKYFIISCIFWLIPGLAAGLFSAVFFSIQQYDLTVRLTESALEDKSLPQALKSAVIMKNNTRQDTAADRFSDNRQDAEQYLESYGYGRLSSLPAHLPYTMGICISLFQGAGIICFFLRLRQNQYQRVRIGELTEYLKAAGHGQAKILSRKEDEFSYLEDEIYKTVFELACTKEEAVKDHEILTERIADIAHQLKTPLTSMSLMAELLGPAQTDQQEYLDRLKAQVERLKALVSSLLTLARLDSHTLEFRQDTIDMEELIHMSAEPLHELMRQKNIRLNIRRKSEEEIWIQTDMQWSAEAILNILKNCVEHTPENGEINVFYETNPLYVLVTAEDGGTGIPKKDLSHLFERFYRGEKAAKDSAGIGLALARSIIEAQNGQIRAENSPAGHARFTIKWYHP